MTMYKRFLGFSTLAFLLCFSVGCDLIEGDDEGDEAAVASFVSSIRSGNQEATLEEGNFPEATANSGNAPTLSGSSQLVRGGSLVMQVSSENEVDDVLIGILNEGGFYRLSVGNASGATSFRLGNTADSPQALKVQMTQERAMEKSDGTAQFTVYTVVITSANNEDYSSLPLQVATQTGDEVTQAASFNVGVNEQAATGEQLQVSLNWNQPVDLDLHVATPNDEDIYYANPIGENGGMLDLDSNPGCTIDNVNNENITWSDQTPATGNYVIRVDLWSACNVSTPIPYVVTVNVCGTVNVFDGIFQPSEADQGGAFSGRVITTLNGASFPCSAATP